MADSRIPHWLTGVWQRLSIETADGQKDTTTQVVYIQTPSCYADIRIPGGDEDFLFQNRLTLCNKASFTELSEPEIAALARQQGFAGVTEFNQSVCCWHRYMITNRFQQSEILAYCTEREIS